MGRPKKPDSERPWSQRMKKSISRMYQRERYVDWKKRDEPLLTRIRKVIRYLNKRIRRGKT